jgi:hypothetical protein
VADQNQNPGCLGGLLKIFGVSPEAPAAEAALPYRRRDDFLSPAELSFYRALQAVVDGRLVIAPKVNLADVFFVTRPNENQGARARISQKHVDFLLCHPQSMKPVAGLELDDSSHARADRQERDVFVNQVFAAAGLPLIRVTAAASYSPQDIAARLAPLFASPTAVSSVPQQSATQPTGPAASASATPPPCPKCGVPMVVRTAGKGEHQGRQFYGCPNFPKCRETIS